MPAIPRPPLIYADREWSAHRRFHRQVAKFLRPGASVVIIENDVYSTPSRFRDMVEEAGLTWVGVFPAVGTFHFVWSRAGG